MKSYYRLMLGAKSIYAQQCFDGNFIGVDYGLNTDLTGKFPDDWKAFNQVYIPAMQQIHPGMPKVSAGLACATVWVVGKGIEKGDMVLCPDGQGDYRVAEVVGPYEYAEGQILPHRRAVLWNPKTIARSDMSTQLQNSTRSIGTYVTLTKYAQEIENLFGGLQAPKLISTDETVEDAVTFALEKHLEDFLVSNWKQTDLGKLYDIFEADGEMVGRQYPSDTGPIDILAISKDKRELLIVELKRGRASDNVVGQIQRYMGYVQEVLAENNQTVKGVIIALEDDLRLRRALVVAPNISFYRYEVSFRLFKV